jgi:hypothetical protein
MKKSYSSISQLFGIVFLLTLLFTPVVSAQPAIQYLNVLGSSFTPTSSTQGYSTGEGCIWDTGGIDSFSFPVLLPRGSLIKRLEFYFFEFTPPIGPPAPPFSTLALLKYDPLANTSTELAAIPLVGILGKLKLITAELNITVETDCTVDSKCFYELTWHPKAANTSRLCGARIHYNPPFGAVALPIIQNN